MKWYTKYLDNFNVPFANIEISVIQAIREKLTAMNSDCPLVSIILIAHNEENHILSCIGSLLDNEIPFPVEFISVNNASTDGTENVLQQLGITYYNEIRKGPGYARQCGLIHARGKYILCIDSDTIYPPHYVLTHINELSKPKVVCTYGLWSFMPEKPYSKFGLMIYESFRDIYLRIQNIKRPELCVRGMTFGFKADIASTIGFRNDIVRGEDGSLALAMKPFGKLVFITSYRVRVLTAPHGLKDKGSLLKNMLFRLKKAIWHIFHLFYSSKVYKDKPQNMLRNK